MVNEARAGRVPAVRQGLPERLPAAITIATWNLGYAGLGAGSDFVSDGGHSVFPPSRQAVDANLAGIARTLGGLGADVTLLQEVSEHSPLSLWAPVRHRVEAALGVVQISFVRDMPAWGLAWPLPISHGMMSAARANASAFESVPLPGPPRPAGVFRRQYALQVFRYPIEGGGEWVIANLHLSAFDDGALRRAQVEALMAFATAEHARGGHVVLGGDWNLVLSDPHRPSTTEEKFLFWIHEFPRDLLPAGWSILTDTGMPSVRTLERPYVPGENYVTTIDGFVVSPNVVGEGARVIDTGFAWSDHMPVVARLRAV